MIRQENQQTGFADSFVRRPKKENPLFDRVDRLIDWDPIRRKIESLYTQSGPGRPAYPAITLLKVLLLEVWYDLSDPRAEEAISDRLSFRRFLGLNLDDPTPDHSTISNFRARIQPISAQIFALINDRLAAKGLVLKQGTLVDATLVASAARPPHAATTPHDPDARWTKRSNGNMSFGYKAHAGVDEGSGLVRKAEFTPSTDSDVSQFEAMVSGDEQTVYADKAYYGLARSAWLECRGISDGIMKRASRWRPQTEAAKAFNRQAAKIRSGVERVFGTWKRCYAFHRCRYRGLQRNRSYLFVLCTSYNLKRAANMSYGY